MSIYDAFIIGVGFTLGAGIVNMTIAMVTMVVAALLNTKQ